MKWKVRLRLRRLGVIDRKQVRERNAARNEARTALDKHMFYRHGVTSHLLIEDLDERYAYLLNLHTKRHLRHEMERSPFCGNVPVDIESLPTEGCVDHAPDVMPELAETTFGITMEVR